MSSFHHPTPQPPHDVHLAGSAALRRQGVWRLHSGIGSVPINDEEFSRTLDGLATLTAAADHAVARLDEQHLTPSGVWIEGAR
ncbi:hypothetical protein AB0O07_08280 [Streptomyces sp. NPDC093085]|uniref:hypothetical protein n=1 Tax=Streptomyces sp. NPDC093085 TaxID=3155068 RepID=UPI0034414C5E